MVDSDPLALEDFEQQVHDCLAQVYDYMFLRNHPLVGQLVPDKCGLDQVQAFRQIVIEAIEQLRPGVEVTSDSRSLRSYNILTLRYIEEQHTQEIMRQLALSERQFYREHRKAIQAISFVLREHLGASDVSILPEGAITLASEVQRMQSQADRGQVDLLGLLDSAVAAVQSLAIQHGVIVEQSVSDPPPVLCTDRGVLRQVVIWIMSQLIVHSRAGDRVWLQEEVTQQHCCIIFRQACQRACAAALQADVIESETLKCLIELLEADLSYAKLSPNLCEVHLELPLEHTTILVIDDNPDVIDLFRRYLAGQMYQLVGVSEGKHAIQMAREMRPEIIVLDVMLPGQDGWEILQNLKNHPVTRQIPVLVCSVLDAPDLAFSLGANGFVKKPPGRMDFLNELAHWQGVSASTIASTQ